jgi:hypothetical protein
MADTLRRVAASIGMSAKHAGQMSGHSVRAGVTQDLLALKIDLAYVMQAGRWKSTRMNTQTYSPISRYGPLENLQHPSEHLAAFRIVSLLFLNPHPAIGV